MSSDPALAYQNESFLDSDDGRPLRMLAEYLQPLQALPRERIAAAAQRLIGPYGDSLIPEATSTLQSARASCAVGKVGFPTALNAFTALLAYRMKYAEEVCTLSSARAERGLVRRGPLDWEGSVR